jgi:hypothetical protein
MRAAWAELPTMYEILRGGAGDSPAQSAVPADKELP